MRRRELSNEELNKVIKLRQAGTSWLKIQHETGIHRRTVKRAYDKWEHSQSLPELKEARKGVAEKAFLDHLKSLTTLAGSLVANLSVPSSPDDMKTNAEQFFSELWHQDLLLRWTYIPSETREYYLMSQEHKGDMQFNFLENELLFKCLQDHTRGEGVRWKAWDEWQEARDNCRTVLDKLQKETSEGVNNFLKQEQERETNFLQRVKEGSREDDPVKVMGEAVLEEIWRARDKLDEEGPWFKTVVGRMGSPEYIDIIMKCKSGKKVFTFIGETNIDLAKKVARICELPFRLDSCH